MMFDISISSLVANINTYGTVSHVDMNSGSSVLADIRLDGYTWEIENPMDIQAIPFTAGSTFPQGNSQIQDNTYPTEIGFTMKQVSSLNPTASLLNSASPMGIGLTSNYLFASITADDRLNRISLLGGDNKFIAMAGDESLINGMVVYSDTIVYALYLAGANVTLGKFDFCEDEVTVLSQWANTDTFNGNSVSLSRPLHMTRCKYGDDVDCLVISEDWEFDDYEHSIVYIHIYDLLSDSMVHEEFLDGNSEGLHVRWVGFHTPHAAYNDKVLFSLEINSFDSVYDPYDLPTSICLFPTFLINCTSRTVTRIDNYKINPNDVMPTLEYFGSCIDRSTGIYYFWAHVLDGVDDGLMKVDLSSAPPIISAVSSGITYEAWLYQSDVKGYAVTTESPSTIRSLPALTTLGSFTDVAKYGQAVVDYSNGRVWFYDETQLYGVDLGGGASTTIPINWVGGAPAGTKKVLWLLAGKALVRVTPANDIYALTAACT